MLDLQWNPLAQLIWAKECSLLVELVFARWGHVVAQLF